MKVLSSPSAAAVLGPASVARQRRRRALCCGSYIYHERGHSSQERGALAKLRQSFAATAAATPFGSACCLSGQHLTAIAACVFWCSAVHAVNLCAPLYAPCSHLCYQCILVVAEAGRAAFADCIPHTGMQRSQQDVLLSLFSNNMLKRCVGIWWRQRQA